MKPARRPLVLLCATACVAVCLGVAVFSAAGDGGSPSADAAAAYGEPTPADLASTQTDSVMSDAVYKALKAGEIHEGQNPCTYPAALRAVIELSDEQCAGELGRVLAEQFD